MSKCENDDEYIHHNHKPCDCVPVEAFRVIALPYEGISNDGVDTVVNNRERTIEVKLKSQQYGSKYAFPNRGDPAVVYVDIHENKSYRWDETTGQYVCIGADYTKIKIINGGTANGNGKSGNS